jgi:hypothetical protein
VIVDLLVGFFEFLIRPLLEAIPDVSLGLPAAGNVIGTWLAKVDSLIPILGPLRLVAALLGLLVVWFAIRGVLLVRHVVLP